MAETVESLEARAPAKINLCLRVLGRRPDGFHDIFSIMQAVDLYDDLSFERMPGGGVTIDCNDPAVPLGDDNLIAQAYYLMKDRCSLTDGLRVKLRKRIPIGSGLGGGSSDCATTIKAINKLSTLSLSKGRMMEIGAQLGSDVPFFLSSGSAIVEGRGEVIRDIEIIPDFSAVIVVPEVHISTGDIYSRLRLDLTNENMRGRFTINQDSLGLSELTGLIGNDLEELVVSDCPEVRRVRDDLAACGLENVSMSGSGSAVFALAPVRRVDEYKRMIRSKRGGWKVFVVCPIRLAGVL
jgi:4-diphosphocytidyl-2-C-methyl-D-erythritol kinase